VSLNRVLFGNFILNGLHGCKAMARGRVLESLQRGAQKFKVLKYIHAVGFTSACAG
jgi:hypothetical protein